MRNATPGPETIENLAPHQYDDIYRELDAPLSDVRRSGLRLVVYGGGIFILIVVTLAALVAIPRHLRFPFVLKGSVRERVYRFPDNVYVDAIHVAAGAGVRRGEPLVAITSPRVAALIAAHQDALRRRELFARGEHAAYQARIDEARLRRRRLVLEIAGAEEERALKGRKGENELRALRAEAGQARTLHERLRQLDASGNIAELELKEAESRATAAAERLRAAETGLEVDLRALDARARQLALDRDMAARDSAAIEADREGRRAALDAEVAAAAGAIELNYGPFRVEQGSLQLLAPADGIVSYLFEGERELPAGSILITVKGADSGLYASAVVPPGVIGFIHAGEAAALEVATFPHYHWGALKGSVASVSLTPDEKGTYPLRVAIGDAGRLAGRLGAGMTGEMSVAVEERTLVEILFEKLDDIWTS